VRALRAWILTLAAAALVAAGPAHAQSCSALVAGPASFSGIVNTYYPGSGTAGAGSTSIALGSATGIGTAIAAGDLVLVVQMQDASIDSSNTSSYGGSGGGQGQTSVNNSGLYEYAVATNAVPTSGGTLTLASGLVNTYRSAAANGVSGQKTFQVVRVPQASSATITADLQAPAWNGSTGGIVAIDVAGNLSWGGRTIDVAGRGFRGGGGQCSIGSGGTWSNQDYRTSSNGLTLGTGSTGTVPNGAKGEGVAGSPIIVFTPATPGSNVTGAITNTGGTDGTTGGYPNGSFGRGAPGNGGGGGTDGHPPTNDENTGGAGGGNYGIGGKGGYGWTGGTPPGFDTGGFGGMAMPNSAARLFMGGGGGAGSSNNCTGSPGFAAASSGAAGGGMVFVRAGTTTGTVSIAAKGTDANTSILNDASGGGGAGGTVLVFVNNGGAAVGASIDVRGGNGGSNTGSGSPHGPGGGGSGGFAIVSGSAAVSVAGGVNGTTATSPTSTIEYGSTSSVGGFQIVNLGAADIPGAGSATQCFPRLTVTKSTSTPVASVGSPVTWTLNVSNLAGRSAATGVVLSDPLVNPNITYAGTSTVTLGGGATRPVTTNPTPGDVAPAWGGFTIPGGGSVAITFVANTTTALPAATYQNPANVNYLDPTRTASQTVTPGGAYLAGAALGTVPGSNYAPGSSTNEDVTFVAPPVFTKSFNPAAITVGAPSVLTVTFTNPGATALTGAGFTDTYPAGVVNTAAPAGASSCGGSVAAAPGGTGFTLAGAAVAAGGSCTVTVNVTMTSPGPYTNTIPAGALANTQNITNTAAASATLFTNVRVTKSFAPIAVAPGADSTLSLAIVNDNTSPLTLANPGLTDLFPAGLVATGGPVTVTGAGCTGFMPTTVGANATSLTLIAGTLPALSTCTVSLAVHSATTGIYANTAGGVTTVQNGTLGPVSNTANLGVGVIYTAKSFSPSTIVSGGTSTVTITLTNPTGVAQTGANFTDTLVNMAISAGPATGGTCAPATAIVAGQTALNFSGINVPVAGCTITFGVTSSSVGAQSNTAGGVATSALPRGPTSNAAVLNVLGRPSIAKAFAPTTINANGTSTLTFTITNGGPVALSGAAFTDTYPAGLVNATPLAVGGSCTGVTTTATPGGNTFNVTAGNLPAASSCTITVAVTAAAAGIYNNATATGVATTQTGAALPGSQSNTATLNVAATPTIAKAFGTSPIAQGGTSTLTFTVSNSNTSVALTNVRFTDALAGMSVAAPVTFASSCGATNSPTLAAGATALDITIPTLAAAGSCTVSVVVTSSVSGSWPNTTSGATSTQTPTPGTPSNTATLVVLSPPMIAKAFAPSIIQAGGTSTMTFTLTNPQATPLTNVKFTDTLANMSVSSATIGGTCAATNAPALVVGATSLDLTVATLAASASCTITVSVTSTIVSPAGGHPNTTSAVTSTQTPTNGGAPASAALTVLAAPTITKSFSPSSVAGTGITTITFTLTNPSAITLTNVRFSDTFPTTPGAMTTPAVAQSYTGAGRGTCVGAIPNSGSTSVGSRSFAAITMPANSSCTIMVDVRMAADGLYTNTTSGVISNQTPTAGAPATGVVSRGRIGITKAFSPATVQVGGNSTLSFALLNNSGATVNDLQLTDTFPAGMVAAGGPVTVAGACTHLAPAAIAANATAFTLTDLDNLASGATCTISFAVTANTAGVLNNTVSGTSPAAIAGVTSAATLTAYASPTIAKSFSPSTIAAGGTSTITFTLTNPNAFPLSNASFTDTLTNMSVSGAQTVGGSCLGTTPSTLAAGATALAFSGVGIPASATCTVTVLVTSALAGARPNTVSGVTTTQTPVAGPGSGPINLTVAGIDITKSFAPASRPLGVPSTLTLLLTSPAAVAWTGLGFTDTLPANLVIANPANATTTCPSGTVTATPGTAAITLAGGTMAAGASPCAVNVDVVSSIAATYNNAAGNFTGLSPGATYTGGTQSVVYFPNATVTKAFAPATISAGGTSTLTFTITNPAGSQAVTGLAFTDTLPANVVVALTPLASNTCGATFAPTAGSSVLTLTGGSRPAGLSSCTAQVNVTSSVPGAYGNATANFSALAGGLTANGASATLAVVGTALTKAFVPAAIGRGGVSKLAFTIANGAGNPAQAGLAFTETLPTNLFVAGAPAIANTCGGTVTAVAATSTIQLAGGALAAGAGSCTVSVDVTSAVVGSYFNGPSNITGTTPTMDASGVNATLAVAANPTVTKAFAPAAVGLNTNSVLTITLANPNAVDITGAAFTDTYTGTSIVNAPVPAGASTCGGTVTAAAGANSVALAGGTIPAGGSCTVSVNVRSGTAGSYTNNIPIGSVSSANAGANAVAASAVLNVLGPLTVAKSYAPNPIVAGTTTTLTITLTNPNAFAAATGAAFTDANPPGVLDTAAPAPATTCGGTPTVTAAANGASVALANAVIPAGGSCTVSVQQSAAAGGAYPNTIAIGDVTTTNAGANTAPATATLNAYSPPLLAKAFGAAIGPGGSTSLTFTVTNPATNPGAVSGIGFTDVFPVAPAAMTLFDTTVANTCAASTLTDSTAGALNAGDAGVTAGGISLAAGASCTIAVNVTAPATGSYANTSGAIAATTPVALTGTTASATLTVAQPTLTKAFNPSTVTVGGTTTLVFTLANAAGNPAQSGLSFTDALPVGLAVAAAPNFQSNCPAGGALLDNPAFLSAPGGLVTVANAAMTAGVASCEIRVNVSPSATPTAGACPQPNNTNSAASIGGIARLNNGVTPQCATVNAAVPTLDKAFGGALVLGGTATLTFTISQPANNPTQAFSFTDNLPAGLVVAAGGASGSCTGGSVTANDNAGTIVVAGRQVSGASCTIVVPVKASGTPTAALCPAPQNTNANANISPFTNITPAITAAAYGGGTSAAGACVSVIARPTVTKSYTPGAIVAGATATLTITLGNPNPAVAIAGVAFTDTNPAGVLDIAAPVATNTCGGTLTATAGSGSVALAGGTIPANGSCVITASQSAAAAGSYPNTIAAGDVTSTNAGSNPTAASATLDVYSPPVISKSFAPSIIGPGATSTLTFTITNPAANTQALAGVAFNDVLPAAPGAMVVATPPAASFANCGTPSFTPAANDASLAFSGGSVAVGGTCTVSVNVTAPAAGAYDNTSGAVSATGPIALTGNTAASTLTVSQASLGKAFAPSTIDQGGVSVLTFTITNGLGDPAQSGIAFTDNLPAGLVVATPNGLASTCPSGTAGITAAATSGSIAVTGAAMTLGLASCTISVNVTSPTPGVYTNASTPNIVGAQRITTTGISAALTVQVLPTITKAFGAGSVPVGGTATLSFTIDNTAPSAVNRGGLAFTDTLPAGISIANPPAPTTNGQCGTPAYTAANGTQPFTASSIAVNAGQSCVITLTVRGVTAGVATNGSANVATTGIANGVTNQSITVAAAPTISKAFGTPAIAADGTSLVTFTITNPNASLALTAAGFTDTLTAMTIAAPGGAAGGSCVGAGGNTFATGATSLAFTGLTIPANGSCTVTVSVTSDVPGPHNNQASGVSSAESATGAPSNVAVLTVTAGTPTIAKSFAPASIAFGATSTITFLLSNTNGVALTGAGFTDTLSGMSIASPGGAAGGTCAGANSFATGAASLVFTGLTVPANSSCTVTVVVTSTTPGAHNNQASGVTSSEAAIGAASNVAVLTVTANAPTIAKQFVTNPVVSGQASTLLVTISNANAAPVTIASVTDTFPATPGAGLARAPTPNPATTCAGGAVGSTAGSVTLTGGTVPANGSCTFQIDVVAATAGSYVNTIAAGALTTNAGTNAAQAQATLVVGALANLAVAKAGPASVTTGGAISYTVTVSNAGPDAAGGAIFSDNVPAAITGVGASCLAAGGAACGTANVAGNAVTSTITTLPAGGSVTFTITGTATGAAAVTNTATIAAPAGVNDPVPANNTSSVTTTVLAPDLALSKAHAGNLTIGANATYTITVGNAGTAPSSGVVTVTDVLPAGLGFVSATGTGWACGFAAGTVTCTGSAAIPAGGGASAISLVVSVASVAAPSVNNLASVAGGNEPSALANNNIGSDNAIVLAAAVNAFAPNNAQTALPGTVIFYPHTYTVGVGGSLAFTTAAAITPASPGWTQIVYRDANCNGVLDAAEGVAAPLTAAVAVNPGDTICIVVKDSVPATAPYNSTAAITVSATLNGTDVLTARDLTTVGAVAGAGLTLSKTVRNVTQGGVATTSGSARPDDVLEYTITYTYASSGPLSSIVVTDATPAFTVFVSSACPAPPPNLTGCSVTTQPAVGATGSVVWTLAGSMASNASGSVTYQVRVLP
jgi:uncharacterized repeat protein (TIGR01451 family)